MPAKTKSAEEKRPIKLFKWSHVTNTASEVVQRFELHTHEPAQRITLKRGDDNAEGGIWELRHGDQVIAVSQRFDRWGGMAFWEKKMKSLRSIIGKQRKLYMRGNA